MKKSFQFALVASMALSLVACNKEIENVVSNEGKEEITLSFKSEKPSLTDAETRTSWNGSTIIWSKDDNVRIGYTVNGAWQGSEGAATPAKLFASTALKEDTEIAEFTVSGDFKDTENAGLENPEYKFYGVYPGNLVSGTNFTPTTITFTLPSEQTPAASSFANGVDVMYATSDAYEGIPADRKVDLTWHRVVSHADISMRNVMVEEGETLESITVTAQTGADLTGQHTLDITDGTIALPEGRTGLNYVTVKADNLTFTDGAVEFWFTTLPFTATELTFTVKTNKYTYVRTFSGINLEFLGNARNTLSVNMKKAQKFQDYTESFSNGQGEFIIMENVEGVWRSGSYNDDKYMQASAYINKTNHESEAWLISPSLSILSNSSKLSFNHLVTTFFGDVTNEATVRIREHGGVWETEALPITYPNIETGNYSEFEETTVDLGKYAGKVVEIGFKYISSTEHAGTWRVKDFKVTNAEVKYYPSLEFTSSTTQEVSFNASTVEFTYITANLVTEPTVAVKAGSDDIIDGTPTIAEGKITVNIKANNDEVAKTATLVVSCEGVTGIPELVINQAKKENLVEKSVTLDFSAQNYTNQQEVSSLTVAPVTAALDKGTNSNAPKYYTTGTAVRCYGGNTITLSSAKTIVKAEFTFASGDNNNEITSNVGTYASGVWTGSATSVTYTIGGTSGHRRIQKIKVTYMDDAGDEPTPQTPVITLSNVPTENISADGDVVTVNYQIENPVSGVTVSAAPASGDTWVNTFDYDTEGAISFVVDPKTTTGTRTTTITVSYTGAESKTFQITQNGVSPAGGEPVEVTLQYTGSTTKNMTGENDAATLGLDATMWSVIGDKGSNSNFPGLNKAGDIRLYYADGGSNTITVSSLNDATINYITITYTDNTYSNGKVFVGSNEVSISEGSYPINSSSFTITNGNTSNVQVRIKSILINYTPSN